MRDSRVKPRVVSQKRAIRRPTWATSQSQRVSWTSRGISQLMNSWMMPRKMEEKGLGGVLHREVVDRVLIRKRNHSLRIGK